LKNSIKTFELSHKRGRVFDLEHSYFANSRRLPRNMRPASMSRSALRTAESKLFPVGSEYRGERDEEIVDLRDRISASSFITRLSSTAVVICAW
jgi:hypothetical protein